MPPWASGPAARCPDAVVGTEVSSGRVGKCKRGLLANHAMRLNDACGHTETGLDVLVVGHQSSKHMFRAARNIGQITGYQASGNRFSSGHGSVALLQQVPDD